MTVPAAGRMIDVLVDVCLHHEAYDCHARFEEAVRSCPEVRECLFVTHDMSYRLRIQAPSPESFELLRCALAERLPGVKRMTATFVLRDVLRRQT